MYILRDNDLFDLYRIKVLLTVPKNCWSWPLGTVVQSTLRRRMYATWL